MRHFAVALLLALSCAANAAVVTGTFTINSAAITDLYSTTFDSPLVPCGASPTQECTFFNGNPAAGRAIAITNIGTGGGSLNVDYDSSTGEIVRVNSLHIGLPDLVLVITTYATTITVTQGNTIPVPYDTPFIEAGIPTLGRDLDGSSPGTVLGQGTPDADQGVAIGQVGIFQHTDNFSLDVPDFAVLTDIVDSCSGPFCALATSGLLSFDGVRYRLEGTVNGSGGDSLVLKTQTANNSIYRVNLSTAVIPIPPAVWLFGSALSFLGLARRKAAA